MSIEDLVVRPCIEEDNICSEKRGYNLSVAKANVVEHEQSSKFKKNKSKREGFPRNRSFKGNASTVTR